MNWLIHDYREDGLAEVVHLIDSTAELGQESFLRSISSGRGC
ncbi:hypothetical protein [Streptomyces sp. NPDC048611]